MKKDYISNLFGCFSSQLSELLISSICFNKQSLNETLLTYPELRPFLSLLSRSLRDMDAGLTPTTRCIPILARYAIYKFPSMFINLNHPIFQKDLQTYLIISF